MAKITNRYTYDNLSRLTRTSYGNGVSTEYGYNEGSLLTSLVSRAPGGSVLRQYGYTYLLDGNRATETEGSKLREYAYDKAGQLTQERVTENGAEKLRYDYGYDSAGNRTYMQKHVDGAYSDFELFINNHANRLIQTSNIDTGVANNFFYDANGNLTRRADYDDPSKYGAFTYDVLGRQTGYTNGTVSVEYDYDADGIRTAKIADGVTTEYVTDGGRVVLELVNGTATARYLYGLGLVHATIGADKYYYSYNGHGDVVQLTDASGNVVRSYEYDAFGNELNPTAGDNNPFRYCGEYFDTETGSYYLRARYYNPQSGRFLTEDPIRDGLNWYAYCNSNPVMFIDPSGLEVAAPPINRRWTDEHMRGIDAGSRQGLFTRIGNGISDLFSGFWTSVSHSASQAWGAVSDGASAAWNWVVDASMPLSPLGGGDIIGGDYTSSGGGIISAGGGDTASPGNNNGKKNGKERGKQEAKSEEQSNKSDSQQPFDILSNKTLTNKHRDTDNYVSPIKSNACALEEFFQMNPTNVRYESNGTLVGDLPDGRTINLHASSKANRVPTVEIYNRQTGRSIKIRY